MKRLIAILLSAVLLLSALAGCSGTVKNGDKIKIIATIFPVYDWVKNITKDVDNVEVSLLIDSGVDMHNFQPTAEDIVNISSCDMFVYVGGESDKWTDDALATAVNKDLTAVNLLESLGSAAKEEEVVEGMEEDDEEDEVEYDEHVWLSLKNAAALCQTISDKLCEKDTVNKAAYEKNAENYLASLSELDSKYAEALKSAKNDTMIFADRFPFRYLTDDYHLKYYAAFLGCSAESEASFKTLVFLAKQLDTLQLGKLITIDGSDQKIAKAVIDTAKSNSVQILTLNSMQSAVAEGDTYLSIMESNLGVLQNALN